MPGKYVHRTEDQGILLGRRFIANNIFNKLFFCINNVGFYLLYCFSSRANDNNYLFLALVRMRTFAVVHSSQINERYVKIYLVEITWIE